MATSKPRRKPTKVIPVASPTPTLLKNENFASIAKRKLQVTEARRTLREKHWEPIKNRLRRFLVAGGAGTQSAIARRLGCEASQVHRYTCPVCEHDAEPTYSTGKAFEEILNQWEVAPKIFVALWRKHTPVKMPIMQSHDKRIKGGKGDQLPKLRGISPHRSENKKPQDLRTTTSKPK